LQQRQTEEDNMPISWERQYIESNPRFALTGRRPSILHGGQMTILYDCLELSPAGCSLEELVIRCRENDYEDTFEGRPTDIRKSILYQLKRMLLGTKLVPKDTIRAL
jgi:hypothetical protein